MKLAFDVDGAGRPVLLLHSTAADRRMWDAQVPALVGAGYRTIRCDLRGYGDTPAPDRPYNDADDVLGLLDDLGVTSAAVVGSSGGGRVALEVAARQPERVTALALLCSAGPGHEPSPGLRAFWEREEALLAAGDVAGAVELNVDQLLGPGAGAEARELLRTMQRQVFEIGESAAEPIAVAFDPSAITAPTLLVTGAHDLPDFREIADRLAAEIPGATRLDLDWAGHLPTLERPDLANPILIGFLTGAAVADQG